MKKEIEAIIEEAQAEQRFRDYNSVEIKIYSLPTLFLGIMHQDSWNLEIHADNNAKEITEERVQKIGINIKEPFRKVIKFLFHHEKGHWRICPFDMYNFEDIISGCTDALIKNGFVKEKKESFYPALKISSNIFEDIIVDTLNAYRYYGEDYLEGQLSSCATIFMEEGFKPSRLITVYNDIQMKILNPQTQELFISSYHKDYYPLRSISEAALYGLFPEKVAESIIYERLDEHIKKQICQILVDKQNWYRQSYRFTSAIAPLLQADEEQNKEDMETLKGSGFLNNLFNIEPEKAGESMPSYIENTTSKKECNKEETSQTTPEDIGKERESSDIKANNTNDGDKDSDKTSKNNEDENEDEKYTYKIKGLNQDALKKLIEIGLGKGRPINYADHYEQLNALYSKGADDIIINILTNNKDDLTTRIAFITHELADKDNIDIKRILWPKTRIYTKEGKRQINLSQGDLQITIPEPTSPSFRGIPDLCIIEDTSASMKGDLWKKTGPISLVKQSVYALFNWIQRTGNYYHMEFSSINFSRETRRTEWVTYKDIDKIKKELFNLQYGGTYLDCNILREHYTQRENPFLALFISDGEIKNSQETADELRSLMQHKNYLSVIHIDHPKAGRIQPEIEELKNETDFHIVRKPEDLIGIHLSYGRKFWGNIS
jgi:hypothetical protein